MPFGAYTDFFHTILRFADFIAWCMPSKCAHCACDQWCDDQYGNSQWLTSSIIYGPSSTSLPASSIVAAADVQPASAAPATTMLSSSTITHGTRVASVIALDSTVSRLPALTDVGLSSLGTENQDVLSPARQQTGTSGASAHSSDTNLAQLGSAQVGTSITAQLLDSAQPTSVAQDSAISSPPSFDGSADGISNTPSDTASNANERGSSLASGPIVGIIFGILFLFTTLAILFCLYRKDRNRRHWRVTGALYPERRNTQGSFGAIAISQPEFQMSYAKYPQSGNFFMSLDSPSTPGSENGTAEKEMVQGAHSEKVPKLTIVGGLMSSDRSSQDVGPFMRRLSSNLGLSREGQGAMNIPTEQLRILQELLLLKGPGSVTSADGEKYLAEQAQNDPRIKDWLESAVLAGDNFSASGKSEGGAEYNIKMEALVNSLGLKTPKEASRATSVKAESMHSIV